MKRAMGAALSCALMALAGCTEGAQETVSFDSAHAATGAVFLETFAGDVVGPVVRTTLACALLVFSAVLVVAALRRWLQIEAAMRTAVETAIAL